MEALKQAIVDASNGASSLHTKKHAWNTILNAVAFDGDDPDSENLDFAVANGLLDAIKKEIDSKEELNPLIGDSIFSVTTTLCLSVRNAKVTTESGLIPVLVKFIKSHFPSTFGSYALTSITVSFDQELRKFND